LKILFLNTFDAPADGGGTEVTIWTLMRSLTAAGHQCVVLSTSGERGLHCHEREGIRVWRAGIRNIYWPSVKGSKPPAWSRLLWHMIDSYNPFMQRHLKAVVRNECPDIVSVHNLPGWSSATWQTLRGLGLPTVQVLHDQYALCAKSSMYNRDENCPSPCASCRALRLPHRALSQNVTAVVGVSRFILDRHLRFGRFSDVKCQQVIHNVRKAASLGLEKPAHAHAGVRIGFIGRLDPSKGVIRLIDAFSQYDRADAELWIAGTGDREHEEHLKRAAQGDPRVRFLGRTSPEDFYPNVDVVVVPSLWNDTFPGVVFESLAFGKPVIGSRRGGIAEMIQQGRNGLLFEPDAPGELLSAIRLLSEDVEGRKAMAVRCRESSEPFLDTTGWVASYIALYEKLLSARPALPETVPVKE
jgi:glycosyltransferase involved in cell wall biosynthesis